MKVLYLSPSIGGAHARLVRLAPGQPHHYELQETPSDDPAFQRAAKTPTNSLLTGRFRFQRWLDEHYPGTGRADCAAGGREPEPSDDDARLELEADRLRRMADMVRRTPGGLGEVADYLDSRASELDRRDAGIAAAGTDVPRYVTTPAGPMGVMRDLTRGERRAWMDGRGERARQEGMTPPSATRGRTGSR